MLQTWCHHTFISTSTTSGIGAFGSIGDGTRAHPYIVHVNTTHPEQNREFNIDCVVGIQYNAYSHTGFDICRTVANLDFLPWEGSIPTSGIPAEYEFRILLIKGPSSDFWVCNTECYHKTGKIACEATKTAHSATSNEIPKDVNRQFLD